MRRFLLHRLACASLFFTSLPALAQSGLAQSGLIQGTLNTRTGLFLPRVSLVAPEALTKYTGTFNVTVNVTGASAFPSAQPITCGVTFSATDGNGDSYQEEATAIATRSGNAATCTMTLTYAWSLAAPATYGYSYSVTTFAASGAPSRSSFAFPVVSAAVPAAGKTTALTIAVTI